STIDQGIVTNLGQLTATVGNSTICNLALGNFTNDGTTEVPATAKLMLDTDTLTNKIGAANGTVKVDATGELDLKTSTIDQGIVTNLGQLTATVGNSTISNLALGNFTNDGTIEVDAAAKLLLDTDTLTNKIGAANGTVKVSSPTRRASELSTIDQGIVTNLGQLTA